MDQEEKSFNKYSSDVELRRGRFLLTGAKLPGPARTGSARSGQRDQYRLLHRSEVSLYFL